MEDVIGFLILLITLIISVAASAKKQRGQNKTTEQSLENTLDESAEKRYVLESSASQTKDEAPASWEQLMGYEEERGEAEEEETEAEEVEEREEAPAAGEDQKAGQETTTREKERETSPYKETYKTKKRRTVKRSKIQEIKERFDVEEGIIYSEILNRKHF
jgi:hypothetical protein